MKQHKIVCYGEVLWDMLPTGKLAGGAPMNVAYHLNGLGLKTHIISRIGNDTLGIELLDFLNTKEVPTTFIQIDNDFQTGVVDVILDEKGSPSYSIVHPVAWDNIEINEELKTVVAAADALVYGSLACRDSVTQQTLYELLKIAQCRVFDVNLRAPFYSKASIEPLMELADIVKMNEEELSIISKWYDDEVDFTQQIKNMQKRFGIKTLIVSHGSQGAYWFENDVLYFQKSFKITVKDTIGSGDAFLAGFLTEKMAGKNPQDCLLTACKAGAYVATQSGATPIMSPLILQGFDTI